MMKQKATYTNLQPAKMLFALLLLLNTLVMAGQENRVNLDDLTSETQKMSSDIDKMTMVWWIPEEFWKAAFDLDPTISKEQAESLIKTFRPYTVMVVIDGIAGNSGSVTYKTEEVIRGNTRLIDGQGTSYSPLSKNLLDAETKAVLKIMKPVFVNMLGEIGANMCFILFPSVNKAKQKILDPLKEGSFSVKVDKSVFTWTLPLSSLIPPKICPVDNKELNGTWIFCPWHGNKLVDKTPK